MKATGVVRKVDELGRVVIPKEIRDTYGIDIGIPIEFYTDSNCIVLARYQPSCACVFCNEITDGTNFKGKNICEKCLKEVVAQ